MAEITRKRSGELVRGVFQILLHETEGRPAKEVLHRLEALVPPTAFDDSTYPNRPNVRRYEKIVRFSTITAVKAGWLVKTKGSWSLTELGRTAYAKSTKPRAATTIARQGTATSSAPARIEAIDANRGNSEVRLKEGPTLQQ